jgi:hypothetical protein
VNYEAFISDLNKHIDDLQKLPSGDKVIKALGIAYSTCCVKCDIRKTCDLAFDPYNQGETPKLTCLAAK